MALRASELSAMMKKNHALPKKYAANMATLAARRTR
jgi:hypothetical protein